MHPRSCIDRTAGIIDVDGIILACTGEILEGREDPSARAVWMSEEEIRLSGRTTKVFSDREIPLLH